MKKKTVKEVKMHNFVVCACKSQDFAQNQKIFAWSHDRVTKTFRNSVNRRPFPIQVHQQTKVTQQVNCFSV